MQMTEALVAAAARCKVSKTTLWAKTVLLRKNWTEEELFKADNQLSEVSRLDCGGSILA